MKDEKYKSNNQKCNPNLWSFENSKSLKSVFVAEIRSLKG